MSPHNHDDDIGQDDPHDFANSDRQINQYDDPHPHANRTQDERQRASHREDLTRNLRHPPHLGRRMPSAPAFLADEPNDGKRRGRYALRQIAAIFMVFIAGGLGGAAIMEATLSDTPANRDFVNALPAISSAGYGIYASEVRHPVEVYADQKDHLVNWLSKRLGVSFSAPDLSSQGFHLIGGRLVPLEDKPGALLMYENNNNQRVTLLVGHNPDNISTGFSYQSHGKIETFYWIDGPIGYAISGEINKENLEDAALVAYRQTGG
ncbi:anti-sigma factor [Thalassospira sp. TSL5-1]|uniref:anti-sigma factor family protein n=1 Tax=Thalassospira sp. TSL5-1 TaxID=1544451 RepID=UPI00093E353F|nr:anti-sigma factor [Thalassospira sp. TSL5-1]